MKHLALVEDLVSLRVRVPHPVSHTQLDRGFITVHGVRLLMSPNC